MKKTGICLEKKGKGKKNLLIVEMMKEILIGQALPGSEGTY
jgi:hypothetical protein